MLMMSNTFESRSALMFVIPAVNPVVVNDETDSNRESKKFFPVRTDKSAPVKKDIKTNRKITRIASLNVFSSL